jgi:hypothetical protein
VRQLRAFAQLTYRDQVLLLQAFMTLAMCRARLFAQNIEALQAWANRPGHGDNPVHRLAWAVELASRRIPRTTCLCRALSLQRLLTKNGHSSELRIGVQKDNDRFGAHAWLVHRGQVLIGSSQLGRYELLVTWHSDPDLSHG